MRTNLVTHNVWKCMLLILQEIYVGLFDDRFSVLRLHLKIHLYSMMCLQLQTINGEMKPWKCSKSPGADTPAVYRPGEDVMFASAGIML
jgi:hypothetical protein